jgi:transcriptional regulator with XRE-family HTH domain
MIAAPLCQLGRIRRERRLTQSQLAKAVGLSQHYVSQLERGLIASDVNHVLRLAAVLSVDASALTASQLTICTSPSGVVSLTAG